MFEQQKDLIVRTKAVHLILNGHPEVLYTHQYSKPLRKHDIEVLCDKHMDGRFKSARFFSIQGVELMEQDLAYVRNNDRIYVSRGSFGKKQVRTSMAVVILGNISCLKLQDKVDSEKYGWLVAALTVLQQQSKFQNCKKSVINLSNVAVARDIDVVFREVETLKALSHPNIVKIINCYALPNMQMIVVMEFLEGGELLALLKEKTRFDQPTARKIFKQIVAAVSHCHRQSIIHRDLKLENVLLENKEKLRVKVADFGISGVADAQNPDVDVGTLRYMAPEVLSKKQKSNTAAVDVWACGVMLYCMVFGRLPFAYSTSAATTQAIITGSYKFPQRNMVSIECKDLIMIMLTIDPKMRPTINDIQEHPWMKGINNAKTVMVDRIIEDESPDHPIKMSPQKERKKQLRKRLPIIPKRLEREKEQIAEEVRQLRGSRSRIQYSDPKFKVGSPPRYMQNIRCKQLDRGIKRRPSFVSSTWK